MEVGFDLLESHEGDYYWFVDGGIWEGTGND